MSAATLSSAPFEPEVLRLFNETLSLSVLPQLGGKMASLVYLPQKFEVFFQPEVPYRPAEYGAPFAGYDTSGADEMFPTIDGGYWTSDGQSVLLPDHGELWSQSWEVLAHSATSCSLQARGRAFRYLFRRDLRLEANRVYLDYEIISEDLRPIPFLWTFHGLLNVDEESKLTLPNVLEIINVHSHHFFGEAGETLTYPDAFINGRLFRRLNKIGSADEGDSQKFYVNGVLNSGVAGVTLNQNQLSYLLNFDPKATPFLGVWINRRGYKNQYNAALEPSTAFYDSPSIAKANGRLPMILPNEKKSFSLIIELTPRV